MTLKWNFVCLVKEIVLLSLQISTVLKSKVKRAINALGVIFDSKKMWQPQVENVIKRASKAKHKISLIKKIFQKE